MGAILLLHVQSVHVEMVRPGVTECAIGITLKRFVSNQVYHIELTNGIS